jgi:protein involved in sex pheromone biosynthesis
MRLLTVSLLAALLVSGCGDERTPVEKKLAEVDYKMANLEVGVSPSPKLLAQLTRQYILLTRQYAESLGRAQVKRKLEEKELELQAYCLPCSGLVSQELARL